MVRVQSISLVDLPSIIVCVTKSAATVLNPVTATLVNLGCLIMNALMKLFCDTNFPLNRESKPADCDMITLEVFERVLKACCRMKVHHFDYQIMYSLMLGQMHLITRSNEGYIITQHIITQSDYNTH